MNTMIQGHINQFEKPLGDFGMGNKQLYFYTMPAFTLGSQVMAAPSGSQNIGGNTNVGALGGSYGSQYSGPQTTSYLPSAAAATAKTPTGQTKTTNTGSSSGQNLNDLWKSLGNTGDRPVGWNGPGGGGNGSGGGVDNAAVDAAWAPYFSNLDSLQGTLGNQRDAGLADITQQGQGLYNALPGEEQTQRDTINQNALNLGQQARSAYDKATRDYNALRQQAMALYGGQNSAGYAMNDLAQQGYLQNNGTVQDQEAQGNQQIAGWNNDVTKWVTEKHNQIDTWLADSKRSVQNLFDSGMQQINNSRTMAEGQKAQNKMDLLATVQNLNNDIASKNAAFKQQVVLYAAMKNPSSNTAFDASAITGQLGNVFNTIGQTAAAGNQYAYNPNANTGASTPNIAPIQVPTYGNNNNDQLNQLLSALTGSTGTS